MTAAETSHLEAFVLVCVVALVALGMAKFTFAGTLLVVNIFMNLYPALLQQQNKRRLDAVIIRLARRRSGGRAAC